MTKLARSMATIATLIAASSAAAEAQTSLKVIVFPGMSNLMQFAAQSHGYYTKRGLDIDLIYTPNSTELRNGLAEGRYHIAHGGVDNAVAQAETAKVDLFIFMGGNNGNNSLYVQPEINSYDDLRGKVVGVDSPNTAFALLAYKMLQEKGLKKGDYEVKAIGATHLRIQAMMKDKNIAASILSPPATIPAQRAGLKSFGTAVSVVGPYQSDAGWVLRSWGQTNADTLTRYIQANVEGIRWVMNPANRAALTALLAEKMKQPPEDIEQALRDTLDKNAYATDAQFDMKGFDTVLKLRAEMLGTWGANPPPPASKYLDLSYYQRALAGF